jgi:lipid II:glycine glycyltransferase (peptidoglycan interpeptide bridge formation enzyme)
VTGLHEVRGGDLDGWDARAVDAPGGQVFQSRAYGEFQATLGWRVRYLQFDDGSPVLVLQRRWPWIGGWSAYVPRGPVPVGDAAANAARQIAVARWLAERGTAVIAADPEVEAGPEFSAALAAAGFRSIEELQPSRHRMRIPLRARSEAEVFAGIAKSTRQRIRQAAAGAVEIRTLTRDAPDVPGAPDVRAMLDAFYDLLRGTGDRRGFSFGSRREFVEWWERALAAGHLAYLHAVDAGTTIAGLLLYRHGGRLSTVHSADLADARAAHPGVLHLLRWRAIQLAIEGGCDEMDLGGVDVAGARRVPEKGEQMYGLYEHKRSFGAEWVELAGAHELVTDRLRYAAGRLTQRLAREVAVRRPGGSA